MAFPQSAWLFIYCSLIELEVQRPSSVRYVKLGRLLLLSAAEGKPVLHGRDPLRDYKVNPAASVAM